MSGTRISPLTEDDVPAVTQFIWRSVDRLVQADGFPPRGSAPHELEEERRFQARISGYPYFIDGLPRGWVLRDRSEALVGALLAFAWRFRLGEHRLLGLAAGPFFVDPDVRLQGFFMLRQLLNTQSVDLFYANTCNATAGALWTKLGGTAVPNSDVEYLVVFNPGPVAQEFALRRNAGEAVSSLAGIAGGMAAPLAWRRRSGLRVEPTGDWERMAATAEQHRDRELLTGDRSVTYLRGSYQEALERKAVEIYCFRDAQGNEGWFSLARATRGRVRQIRSAQLLDVVWPRGRMDFDVVLAAIADAARSDADLLSIRARPGIPELQPAGIAVLRRSLPAPEAFVRSRFSAEPNLSARADFATADAV